MWIPARTHGSRYHAACWQGAGSVLVSLLTLAQHSDEGLPVLLVIMLLPAGRGTDALAAAKLGGIWGWTWLTAVV